MTNHKAPRDVYRSVQPAPDVERSGDGPKIISGYASVFNVPYEINSMAEGRFIERIAPGAFEETFNRDREAIRLLLDHGHDPSVGMKPLGRITELREDGTGAFYKGELFDTQYVRELIPALEANQYGASFRFRVEDQEWDDRHERTEDNPDGLSIRTITRLRVMELGPTTFGASPSATASVRSATDRYTIDLAQRNVGSMHNEDDTNRQVEDEPEGAHAKEVASESNVRATDNENEELMSKRAEDPKKDKASEEETDERAEKFDADGNPDPNGKYDKDGNLLKDEESEEEEDERAEDTESEEDEEESEEEDKRADDAAKDDEEEKEAKSKRSFTVPKSYDECVARINEIDARHVEIDTAAGDKSLTRSAKFEYDSLEDERAAVLAAKEAIEKRRNQVADRAASGSVESVRSAANVTRKPENLYDVYDAFRGASNEADVVRSMKDRAKWIIEERGFDAAEGVDREANQEHLTRLLAKHDKEGAVSRHLMTTGSPEYASAWSKFMQTRGLPVLTTGEARALALGVDASGGYKVPFDLDPTVIMTTAGVINPLREMSTVKQIVGKEWQGVTSAGSSVARASDSGEGDDVTIQNPTFGQVRANTQRVDFRVDFSIEIDATDPANMSDLVMILKDAKDTEEANTFVNGTGNGLTGVQGVAAGLPSGSLVEMTSPFSSDDIYALDDDLDPRHQANAQFLARKSTYNMVRRLGSDSDGGDLWERLPGANPNELIGYAARVGSHMPAYVAENTDVPFLLLGDFKKYLIVDRIGMVMDVDPFTVNHTTGRHTGQRSLVAYWWNGGVLIDPNAFRGLVDAV